MARDGHEIEDATLSLLIAPGIGPVTLRKLRQRFGDDAAVLEASVSRLAAIEGIGRATAQAIRRGLEEANPHAEREAMHEAGAKLILPGDDDYPPLLAAIDDPPTALWIRGQIGEADQLSIAIVGSRRCTSYGREQAGRFGALLAQSGLTIVSGGALGIDGEAHRGALRVRGRTIAVLGCGLGVTYPEEHADLFARIVDEGGLMLSELPMRAAPLASNFPRRNRIISGLSLGVLVIEAAARSGALITARLAAEEHGREVMALPGRVDSPASAGCLKLLRDGGAGLVTDHADVLMQLDASGHLLRGALASAGADAASSPAASEGAERQSTTLFDAAMTEGQAAVIRVLRDAQGPLLPDQLAARTRRPMSELMADLTLLQIRGRIRRDHRGVTLRA
ncbi:MAG: DNA-processing protein DprA [Planctomycetota bacterium]|nr:DNA-processing protein DprA [Planctomycetota bacterium]